MLQGDRPVVDRPRRGLSVIPSPRGGGMECYDRVVVGGVNQMGRPRRVHSGVMTATTRAHHELVGVFMLLSIWLSAIRPAPSVRG